MAQVPLSSNRTMRGGGSSTHTLLVDGSGRQMLAIVNMRCNNVAATCWWATAADNRHALTADSKGGGKGGSGGSGQSPSLLVRAKAILPILLKGLRSLAQINIVIIDLNKSVRVS
jgi:hypothetical protein